MIINIKHNKVFFLHWSKELRIKNTTGKGSPVKVALFISNIFHGYFLYQYICVRFVKHKI